MKHNIEIGNFTNFDTFRINRDQVKFCNLDSVSKTIFSWGMLSKNEIHLYGLNLPCLRVHDLVSVSLRNMEGRGVQGIQVKATGHVRHARQESLMSIKRVTANYL